MLLKYVEEFIDRHGKPHRYFRRAGKRVRLPGLPGSAEFMAVYQAALDGLTEGLDRHIAHCPWHRALAHQRLSVISDVKTTRA